MNKFSGHIIVLLTSVLLISCANQQPPPGGDDDKTPPKLTLEGPEQGALNFKGDRISFEFDEYVDRRSFTDAFFISPKPRGSYEFDWSGKSVEIIFDKKFEPDRTYRVVIGKVFKDIHGNSITTPFQFAFSTGNRIDRGVISGRVYASSYDRLAVYAYLTDKQDSLLNPERNFPDFGIPCDDNGNFRFENLPAGNYRLFAVYDNDRNQLYEKDFDRISVLSEDKIVNEEEETKDCLFIMQGMVPDNNYFGTKDFYSKLSKDSADLVYSSVLNGEKDVPVNLRCYFYFRDKKFNEEQISDGFFFNDSSGNNVRYVKNWINDSLLEVLPFGTLHYKQDYVFGFDISDGIIYRNKIVFTTAEEKKSGSISGFIFSRYQTENPVFVRIFDLKKPILLYNKILNTDSLFSFAGLLEGNYGLFAFIDANNNGKYDSGSYYPFGGSEKFFYFDKDLFLKGGWKVEDVTVRF